MCAPPALTVAAMEALFAAIDQQTTNTLIKTTTTTAAPIVLPTGTASEHAARSPVVAETANYDASIPSSPPPAAHAHAVSRQYDVSHSDVQQQSPVTYTNLHIASASVHNSDVQALLVDSNSSTSVGGGDPRNISKTAVTTSPAPVPTHATNVSRVSIYVSHSHRLTIVLCIAHSLLTMTCLIHTMSGYVQLWEYCK